MSMSINEKIIRKINNFVLCLIQEFISLNKGIKYDIYTSLCET